MYIIQAPDHSSTWLELGLNTIGAMGANFSSVMLPFMPIAGFWTSTKLAGRRGLWARPEFAKIGYCIKLATMGLKTVMPRLVA